MAKAAPVDNVSERTKIDINAMRTCMDSRGMRIIKGENMGGRNLGHGVPGIVVRLADKRSEQLTNHHLFARPHDRKCKDAVKFDPAIGCGLEINTQITLPFEVNQK